MMKITDVEGYEGLYGITDTGEVLSVRSGKMLAHWVPDDGYHRVKLANNGVRKAFQVHRLVAKHFCEGYQEGYVCDHKDGNKDNNNASNLRWCTQKYNVKNQMERGTLRTQEAQRAAQIKNQIPIIAISPHGDKTKYSSTKSAATELSLQPGKVTDVLKGNRKHTGGYRFEYGSNG